MALALAFHGFLALPGVYAVTTVPGDKDPERLIEVLRAGGAGQERGGWRDTLHAALSYAFPRRAFVVEAAVLRSADRHGYGVSLQIRRLAGLYMELGTVWAPTPEQALELAAYTVGAYLLPHTRSCRSAPWSSWQSRRIPPELFRRYLCAKKMIGERRYDEALELYQEALTIDPDNVAMRYEMGQLYERLGLYPDAVRTYLRLVDTVFPRHRRARRGQGWWPRAIVHSDRGRRRAFPRWWPEGTVGPFAIRYRYVTTLSAGASLTQELYAREWDALRDSLNGTDARVDAERRPFRLTEIKDLRQRISEGLQDYHADVAQFWPGYFGQLQLKPPRLASLLADGSSHESLRDLKLQAYLLLCAKVEAESLEQDFAAVLGGRRGHDWEMTLTACRQMQLMIEYRLRKVRSELAACRPVPASQRRKRTAVALSRAFPPMSKVAPEIQSMPKLKVAPREIISDLFNRGYREDSQHWLEHYISACTYSLFLADDTREIPAHCRFAELAVQCLERAERSGEDVAFVTSKQFWIVAGDPDLVGLRRYTAFRAFEGRAYSHPLPAVSNLARYERYAFVLTMMKQGAAAMEARWRTLSMQDQPSPPELEEVWRQELHAWQLAVRLGRFYRQWQTRQHVHEAFRRWSELTGHEVRAVTYPNVFREWYEPYIGDFTEAEERLRHTETMLDHLANAGSLSPLHASVKGRAAAKVDVIDNTEKWLVLAQRASRSGLDIPPFYPAFRKAARSRVALWAALRHWANSPHEGQRAFDGAVRKLPSPPWSSRLARS